MNFTGAHILSINQFQRQDVERVFAVADDMQPYALRKKVTRVLEGAILGNMFFEASTIFYLMIREMNYFMPLAN